MSKDTKQTFLTTVQAGFVFWCLGGKLMINNYAPNVSDDQPH